VIKEICKVEYCTEVAHNTYTLGFQSPRIASSSMPGQFVNILTDKPGNNPLLRRPFSVARMDDQIIEILFHVVGSGTQLLAKKQKGDWVDVIGPLGQSFHLNADFEKAILVGGGIGVAPFPFLTSQLQNMGKDIETYLGFRNEKQIYSDYLANVHIATDDGSKGFHGNVVQLLESNLNGMSSVKMKIFACGPTVMMKSLSEFAKRRNMCCELSLEGQMACGIGICQGCPVERVDSEKHYALVCKDGPTFLSTDIRL
jgi:dihydroorotate dehydrogenase electron transfer subunit